MHVEIETVPAIDDIFIHDVPLLKRATFFPLGFPLELATNSDVVLAAARQSWGIFSLEYPERPLSLSITVTDYEDDEMPDRPRFRSQQHLLSIVSDARNQIICDNRMGCAFGWVTTRVASNAEFLRLRFLEASVMTMLVETYLAPFHSALVTRNGIGVALCGESFAGKSTLSYACARSGWTFISDDGTFLFRNRPGRYALGNPYGVRFREDAKFLFPELEDFLVGRRPNGELGMEVLTSKLPISTASGCAVDHMVFLRRTRKGRASINRFSTAEALAWLERTPLYGSSDVQESQRQAYRRLLEAEIWELHYSNLADAVELLNGLGVSK